MMPGRSNIDIGRRLKVTLEALGISQAELCRRCDFDPPRVNNWIKGTARPDIEAAQLICDTLPITMDWIYRGDASKLPGDLQEAIAALAKAIPIVGTRATKRARRSA